VAEVFLLFDKISSQVLVRKFPVPVEMVAVMDRFGQSGKPEDLLKHYHLDTPDIVNAALKAVQRKRGL